MKEPKFIKKKPISKKEIVSIDTNKDFLNIYIEDIPTLLVPLIKDNKSDNIIINEDEFNKFIEFINIQLSIKIEKLEKRIKSEKNFKDSYRCLV